MAKLTLKRQRFVEEFIVDLNATKAAIRAGFSKKTARSQGQRLLTNVDIAKAIEVAMLKRADRTEVTADRVLAELAKIGFANAGDFFDWGPDGVTIKDKSELTPDQQAAVQEVSETVTEKGGTIRVRLADKQRSLELMGRHLGMFIDKHEHSGPDGEPIQYDVTGALNSLAAKLKAESVSGGD